MPIFDTHAHYDSGGFNADRHEVLAALPAAGVGLVVNPGCDVESSGAAVALAERYPHVYAAVQFRDKRSQLPKTYAKNMADI